MNHCSQGEPPVSQRTVERGSLLNQAWPWKGSQRRECWAPLEGPRNHHPPSYHGHPHYGRSGQLLYGFGVCFLREMRNWDLLLSGGRLNRVKDAIPDAADAQVGLQNRKQQGVGTALIFRARDKFKNKKGEISAHVALAVHRENPTRSQDSLAMCYSLYISKVLCNREVRNKDCGGKLLPFLAWLHH